MDDARALILLGALLMTPAWSAAQTVKPQLIRQVAPQPLVRLDTAYHARIQNGLFSNTVHAGGVSWNCTKGQCSTRTAWTEPTIAACAALAGQVGRVLSFGNPNQALGSEDMAACNRGVGGQPPVLSASAINQARLGPAATLPVLAIRTRSFEALQREREQAEQAARVRDNAELRSAEARAFEQERLRRGLTEKYSQGDDCDDERPDVHRLAAEVCDNRDNNCDGHVDEGQKLAFFLDADGDGHGDPARRIDACPVDQQRAAEEGTWLVPVGNDCNDGDPSHWRDCP